MTLRFLTLSAGMALAGMSLAGSGWQRARVNVPDPQTLQRLLDTSLNLMECEPHLGATDVLLAPGEDATLVGLGFQFVVVGPAKDPRIKQAGWDQQSIQADDYRTQYFTADQILAFFENLRATYPVYVSRSLIGTSILGEAQYAYRIGRPLQQGALPFNNFIVQGLIHAREWISGSVIMHVAQKCVEGLTTIQPSPFMTNQAVWIVPLTNPDGYRYTWTNDRYWRKNRRNNGGGRFGVDLNRNYAKGWGGEGSSSNPESEIYRGTAPFSEPEIASIRDLALGFQRLGGFVDFHSYGQKILWPWSYTTAPPPDQAMLNNVGAQMRTQMNAFGATYIQGQGSVELYIASGSSKDYFYDIWRKPAFTIELRDTGNWGFELPASQITPTQDEAWAGFKKLLQIQGP